MCSEVGIFLFVVFFFPVLDWQCGVKWFNPVTNTLGWMQILILSTYVF
jgi:hypothetical protein